MVSKLLARWRTCRLQLVLASLNAACAGVLRVDMPWHRMCAAAVFACAEEGNGIINQCQSSSTIDEKRGAGLKHLAKCVRGRNCFLLREGR